MRIEIIHGIEVTADPELMWEVFDFKRCIEEQNLHNLDVRKVHFNLNIPGSLSYNELVEWKQKIERKRMEFERDMNEKLEKKSGLTTADRVL